MKLSLKLFIGLCFSPLVTTSNVEFLDDLLPQAYRGTFEISAAEAKFDDGLDILGYMDNLKGSKPKEAEISDYSISYKFHNGLRISTEKNSSFAEATRPVIPKSISTETESDLYFISYPFNVSNKIDSIVKKSFKLKNYNLFLSISDEKDCSVAFTIVQNI